MDENNYLKKIYLLLLFLAFVVGGILFKTLKSVVLPMVFAILFSFVLKPIVQKLNNKTKLPWGVCSILVILLSIGLLTGISTILINSLKNILEEYPKFETKFMSIYQIFADMFNLEFDDSKSFIENMWKHLKVREYFQTAAVFLSTGIFAIGKSAFLFLIMLVLFLTELRLFTKKISYAYIGMAKSKILRIAAKIMEQTVHFISIKFYISLITGVLVFSVCAILKLDFPVVWGFLAFIMNFIPIFGSIFSVGLTTIFALLQFYPSMGKVIFILIFLTAINTALGNIIEPKVEGKHLGLSPFVILVSLTLFGWLWGFVGMLIAVPLTVIIRIVCENIEYLHSIAIILGGDPAETKKDFQ